MIKLHQAIPVLAFTFLAFYLYGPEIHNAALESVKTVCKIIIATK
jgi:hypothetical protein